MFDLKWPHRGIKKLVSSLMVLALIFCLASCNDRTSISQSSQKSNPAPTRNIPKIAEVSPPSTIQELRQVLESYRPQVKILSPGSGEVLQDNTATVKLQVEDLPIFKNARLGLGPHLHVFLDNRPYVAVYDLNEPLIFKDLEPGTHTLRVFASRPWHESFKNQGAYAQITFHILTKTDDNNPDLEEPLLTYSRPQGSYGAEPIMLDFYLANAPLQIDAGNSSNENTDWRIRCTIDGATFVVQDWEPIYLTGFQPGKNWVQLELIDKQGNPVKNAYNNSVRLINYEPNGNDTLSQLVRGELSVADALGIVDPNYTPPPPPPEPTPIETPVTEVIEQPETAPTETAPAEPITPDTPAPEETSIPEKVEEPPIKVESSAPEQKEIEVTKPLEKPEPSGFYNRVISPEAAQQITAPKELEKRKFGGFFNRPRRSEETKLPILVAPTNAPTSAPVAPPESIPQTEVISEPTSGVIQNPTEESQNLGEEVTKSVELNSTDSEGKSSSEPSAPVENILQEDKVEEAGNAEVETAPEITPTENVESTENSSAELDESTATDSQVTNSDVVRETSSSNLPNDNSTDETETSQINNTQAEAKIDPNKTAPVLVKPQPNNVFSKFFDRFRRSPSPPVTPPSSLPPTLPEIINSPTPEQTTSKPVVNPETATPESAVNPEITTSEPAQSETSTASPNPAISKSTPELEVPNLDLDAEAENSAGDSDTPTPEVVKPSEAPGVRKEA